MRRAHRVGRTAARSLVRAAPWCAAAIGTGVALTQVTGWNRSRWVAILQSLTPAIAVSALPVATIGVRRRQPVLTLAGVATFAVLGSVVAPAATRPKRTPDRHGTGLSIAHCNMFFLNVEGAAELAAALLATNADVLALSEITEHHRLALVAAGAADVYPHRVGQVARRSDGVVIWSRHPLTDVTIGPFDSRPGIVATVDAPDGPLRVLLGHPDPPTMARGLSRWEPSLAMIGDLGSAPGPPTVIVADLNASRWHPVFRRLLGRGWRDAHELGGLGLTTSWPTDRRFVPPFIRLDHALLRSDVELVGIRDVDAPGSDHRAFVVTVTAGRPPRRSAR